MKKLVLTMLTMLTAATGAWAQTAGTLSVPEVTRKAGVVRQAIVVKGGERQGVIKMELTTNGNNYRDLQFDLTLPEGITLANEAGTAVVKDNSNVVDEGHVVFYTQDGQTVKFAVVDNVVELSEAIEAGKVENSDNYGKYIADGVVFTIPVNVSSSFEEANATLANIATSDDEAKADIALADANFDIVALLLGDVNDNRLVDIADAVAVVNNVAGKENAVFIKEVADVNGNAASYNDDAKIGEIADAVAIVNIVVGKSETDSNSAKASMLDASESLEDTLDPQ